MRGLFYVGAALGVMALAFWAYQENYRTQSAQAEAQRLSREIGELREALAILRAEWAYLNRPERLAELAELNFDRLGLVPMRPEHFGNVDQVAYPAREMPRLPVGAPVDLVARVPESGE